MKTKNYWDKNPQAHIPLGAKGMTSSTMQLVEHSTVHSWEDESEKEK